jgi:hypothetical protein
VDGVVSPGPTATFGTIVTGGSVLVASVGMSIGVSFQSRFLGLTVSDNNGNTWRGLGSMFVESAVDSRGTQFWWTPSANSGSTQVQAQLTCTNGSNFATIEAVEFARTAGTWESLGGNGMVVSATNPASPVQGRTFSPPGKPCLYLAAGIGSRADFVEQDTGLTKLTTRTSAAFIHCTSYVIEPQSVTPAYTWTLSDFAIFAAAQLINNAVVGDYPVLIGGRGANR